MKIVKSQVTGELSGQDLLDVLKAHAQENSTTFDKTIRNYVKTTWGYDVDKIEKDSDLSNITLIIGGDYNDGGMPRKKAKSDKSKRPQQVWNGLYDSVEKVITQQRQRKKKFITFDDLLAELLEMKDRDGNLKFIKGGDKLPIEILKHRLNTSQIIRQSKRMPNLEGIRKDKKKDGLFF